MGTTLNRMWGCNVCRTCRKEAVTLYNLSAHNICTTALSGTATFMGVIFPLSLPIFNFHIGFPHLSPLCPTEWGLIKTFPAHFPLPTTSCSNGGCALSHWQRPRKWSLCPEWDTISETTVIEHTFIWCHHPKTDSTLIYYKVVVMYILLCTYGQLCFWKGSAILNRSLYKLITSAYWCRKAKEVHMQMQAKSIYYKATWFCRRTLCMTFSFEVRNNIYWKIKL